MKEYVTEQLNAGKKYNEILEEVKSEMVSQMLVLTRGNQTKVSTEFGVNRATVSNFAKGR